MTKKILTVLLSALLLSSCMTIKNHHNRILPCPPHPVYRADSLSNGILHSDEWCNLYLVYYNTTDTVWFVKDGQDLFDNFLTSEL
jgi:uncharacterized lipoprotein YajG